MPSVFFCHSTADKAFVRRLASHLEAYGVYCWIDVAEIKIGDSLVDKIGEAIDSSDYLAVVLSRTSVDSRWVKKELSIALMEEVEERRVVVLPLLAQSLERTQIPPFLRDKLYADFSSEANYFEALMKTLNSLGVGEVDPGDRRYARFIWHCLCNSIRILDPAGHRATWTKSTVITPLRSDITVWHDEQIHSSGRTEIAETNLGTLVDVHDEGGVLTARTEFSPPLSLGKKVTKDLRIELFDAYPSADENTSWIPFGNFGVLQFSVELPVERPFCEALVGSVYYGTEKVQLARIEPTDQRTRAAWRVENPQAGIKYILEWRW